MATLFISDLHLETKRPAMTQLFLDFLNNEACRAEALYILGDLFEAWIGDDDQNELNQTVIHALKNLSQAGVPVYYLHGNRDFLIGKDFLQASGCQLLADPTRIDLYGVPTLLMHGDTLCTGDAQYLKIRTRYRKPFYQQLFLTLPLAIRKMMAQRLRNVSKKHTRQLAPVLMDATPTEINRVMREQKVKLLIHGHTHRPSIHYFQLDDEMVCRVVLSDWEQQGNVLVCEADGARRLTVMPAIADLDAGFVT